MDGPPPDNYDGQDDVSAGGTTSEDAGGSTGSGSNSNGGGSSGSNGGGSISGGKVKTTSRQVKFRTYIDKRTGLRVRIIIAKPKIELIARITQVNMKGLMTVEFSEKIATPSNYTMFNDDFLRLRIIPSEDTKPGENKSLIAWQIVAFRAKEMDIQLNFTDPIVISSTLVNYLQFIHAIVER